MADNTRIPLGTQDGDTIALDDIGGVKYPRSKITLGADGTSDGDVSSANPMPVTGTLTGVTTVSTVTTLGTITNVVHVDDNSGSLTVDNATLSVTGGGVEASALRVTIASDSTGVLSIDDNGGSITVDGTFWQATQPVSIAAAVAVTDNSGSLTVDNAGTFAVQVDGAALQALQLIDNAIGTTHEPKPTGLMVTGGVYNTEAELDLGDSSYFRMTSGGALIVVDQSTSSLIGALTETAPSTDTASSGLNGRLQRIAQRLTSLIAQIPASLGIKTAAASLSVAPASDATFAVSGTVTATIAAGATTIAKAEDVASADGDVGVPFLAVRKATPANTSGTDGDYEFAQISGGRIWTSSTIDTALPAGTNAIGKLASNTGVTIGAVEIASAQTLATVTTVSTVTTCSTVTTVSTLTGGGVAHDGADSGNPIKVGARAAATLSDDTMVANADRTDMVSDLDGALIVRPNFPAGDILTDATSNTDGASTASSVFSATASTRSCITALNAFRTDAGTTPIYVDFRDGTGGSVLWRLVLPPNGGANSPPYCGPCLFRTSANTALAYDVSSATTTVYISVSGYKSKV